MSVSRLCFLPGGLLLRCASAGLFPCFSVDCLSGETGVKIKFVNDENTIVLPEGCREKTPMPGNAPNLYTMQARASHSESILGISFFLSIAQVHRALLLKTVNLWVVCLQTT